MQQADLKFLGITFRQLNQWATPPPPFPYEFDEVVVRAYQVFESYSSGCNIHYKIYFRSVACKKVFKVLEWYIERHLKEKKRYRVATILKKLPSCHVRPVFGSQYPRQHTISFWMVLSSNITNTLKSNLSSSFLSETSFNLISQKVNKILLKAKKFRLSKKKKSIKIIQILYNFNILSYRIETF